MCNFNLLTCNYCVRFVYMYVGWMINSMYKHIQPYKLNIRKNASPVLSLCWFCLQFITHLIDNFSYMSAIVKKYHLYLATVKWWWTILFIFIRSLNATDYIMVTCIYYVIVMTPGYVLCTLNSIWYLLGNFSVNHG